MSPLNRTRAMPAKHRKKGESVGMQSVLIFADFDAGNVGWSKVPPVSKRGHFMPHD